MHSVPAVVAAAIENYNPENGKVLRPPSRKERSFIFNWGVRVGSEANEDPVLKWICLASQACREQHRSFTLSGGNTSKAAKHLREAHGVESGKTLAQAERERSHDEEMASVRRSPLFRNDPARAYLLLETCRIVNNNLPFCLDEYEESLAIRDLVYKDAMQVTVNAKAVRHAIIELYTSTKTEIIAMIAANHIGSAKTFSIVADFWTSKPKATKFLGLRLTSWMHNFASSRFCWGHATSSRCTETETAGFEAHSRDGLLKSCENLD